MRPLLTLLFIAALLALLWQWAKPAEPQLAATPPAAETNTAENAQLQRATTPPSEPQATIPLHQQLDPAVVREVNERLAPANQSYPVVIDSDGSGYVDMGARSTSVAVAVIDENGEVVITDLTQPLPEP